MPLLVVAYAKEKRIPPYLEALAASGVRAEEVFLATPARTAEVDLAELLGRADGLMLTGGSDLQPCLYREARLPGVELDTPVAERDQMEWDLLELARSARVPVFGICRGFQMLNVFLGGTLYQDLALQRGQTGHDCFADRGFALDHFAHPVAATDAAHAFAESLRRQGPLQVNSRHHQGIKDLAPALVACANSPDGVLEAAAGRDGGWWVRAVQWHPENLVARPEQRQLFAEFAAAASARRRERAGSSRPVEVGG